MQDTKKESKPARTRSLRLRDTESETVTVRLPLEQVQWLEEQARTAFRSRSDQLAWVVQQVYDESKRGLP